MRKDYRFMKNIIVTFALISSLVIAQPIYVETVKAAEIEDCDLDGYDDHTGNPVPWIGFDSTKGEAIPGDWDHSTTYKSVKAYQDEHSSKEEAKDTQSSSSGNTAGNSAAKSDNSTGSSTKKSSSTKQSSNNSAKSSTSKNSTAKKETTKNKSSKENESEKVEETTENQTEETTDSKKKKKKKKKKKSKSKKKSAKSKSSEKKEVASTAETENNNEIIAGTVDIDEADGSIIHAGSNLIISGVDFEENVEGIEIEIHSDNNILLGYVNTLEDGSFETKVSIPKELPEGVHEIVLKYQGQTIATKSIEVGAKVADTFLDALTVGFTKQNKGLVPGLFLLAGLFAAGILTLLGGKVSQKSRVDK